MAWIVGIGIFLFLLFAFPKPMSVLLLLLAVGVGVVFLVVRQERDNAEEQRKRITATASYGGGICTDPDYPLSILFRNDSGATVTDVGFTVKGFLPGFSNPRYTNYASWDRVMTPGMHYGACWSISNYSLGSEDPSALRWSVGISFVDFE